MNTAATWGAVSALIVVIIVAGAKLAGTPLEPGLADASYYGLVAGGFFWGIVCFLIKERIEKRHG